MAFETLNKVMEIYTGSDDLIGLLPSNLNLKDVGAILAAILAVGAILKHAFPKFQNRFIPLVTLVGGTLGFAAKINDWTARGLFTAFLVAASGTGIHSGVKNMLGKKTSPPVTPSGGTPRVGIVLLLVSIPALFLCGCVSNQTTSLVRALSKDPATVSATIVTPWGTARLVRVGGQTNNVSVTPDGSVSISGPR